MKPYFEAEGVTLYCADARDVLPQLDAVDCVLTDPPYARDVYQRLGMPNTKSGSGTPARLLGKAYAYSSPAAPRSGTVRAGIRNHQYSSMSIERMAVGAIGHIDELLDDVAREIARLSRRWALVFSDVETCHRWRAQLEDNGMRYVRTGAWVKPDPMPQFSGDRPAVGFEPCTIAHAQGQMRWSGGGRPAVWTYNTVKGNAAYRPDHPCPKPLPLMLELVRLFSDPGETILDPFAGSGTTLLAARIEGRKAIGIEISEQYAEVAARRLERGDEGARRPQQGMFEWEAATRPAPEGAG